MARFASLLLGLGLALGLASACSFDAAEDESLVDVAVTGEAPALTDDEVIAGEPCSAMLAAMVVAADGPITEGRSCTSCHGTTGTIPKQDTIHDLPGPLGRLP